MVEMSLWKCVFLCIAFFICLSSCVIFVCVSVLSQLVLACLSVKLGYSWFGGWPVDCLLDLITNSA